MKKNKGVKINYSQLDYEEAKKLDNALKMIAKAVRWEINALEDFKNLNKKVNQKGI